MISTPAAHKVKSGNIMSFFYLPDWNPSGPKAPCESGYIYIDPIGPVAGKVPNPGPNGLTVFYRVDLSPARWLYMGQYKVLKFNPMSGAEWATLPEKVLLRIHPSDFKANSDSHIQLRKKWLVLLKLKPWAHTLDRIAELLPEGKAFLEIPNDQDQFAKWMVRSLLCSLDIWLMRSQSPIRSTISHPITLWSPLHLVALFRMGF